MDKLKALDLFQSTINILQMHLAFNRYIGNLL